jgi:hypothetical protein
LWGSRGGRSGRRVGDRGRERRPGAGSDGHARGRGSVSDGDRVRRCGRGFSVRDDIRRHLIDRGEGALAGWTSARRRCRGSRRRRRGRGGHPGSRMRLRSATEHTAARRCRGWRRRGRGRRGRGSRKRRRRTRGRGAGPIQDRVVQAPLLPELLPVVVGQPENRRRVEILVRGRGAGPRARGT